MNFRIKYFTWEQIVLFLLGAFFLGIAVGQVIASILMKGKCYNA